MSVLKRDSDMEPVKFMDYAKWFWRSIDRLIDTLPRSSIDSCGPLNINYSRHAPLRGRSETHIKGLVLADFRLLGH